MTETRAEHLAWCKERALEYVDRGDLAGAVASMMSDLQKHPETNPDPDLATFMGGIGLMDAAAGNRARVREWVTGWN